MLAHRHVGRRQQMPTEPVASQAPVLGLHRCPSALPCLRSWRRGWADGPDPEPLRTDISLV